MIVLDTTVLVYAVGTEHPAREPCRQLLAAIGDGRVDATTTPEVIQEFVHVYARRRSRPDAARHGRAYATLLAPLVAAETGHIEGALRLFERQPQLGAFDALLAAVALAHGVAALVSVGAAFASVPRLPHVAPGTTRFERLLAGA